MIFFRKLFRFLHVSLVFAFGMLELAIRRPKTRPERAAFLTRLCGSLMRAGRVTCSVEGPIPMTGAVVSNHLNYTDILLHSAMRPCVFVSKIELRKVPVLGWISMMAGTQYVERGAGGSAQKAGDGMAKGFRDGLPIVFFPEGTTSVGDQPAMPFRSGLLSQSLEAGQPITAGFIHYDIPAADLAHGRSTRNDVHWGDQTLFQHVWNFLALTSVHATVRFAPGPIAFSPAALANRKVAAAEARDAVRALAVPLQTPPDAR